MIFIVLSSLETVLDTVQYMYCSLSLLYHLLRIRLKHQNPLLSYLCERGGERRGERRERRGRGESVHSKCTL
jgi:hypothetical protein